MLDGYLEGHLDRLYGTNDLRECARVPVTQVVSGPRFLRDEKESKKEGERYYYKTHPTKVAKRARARARAAFVLSDESPQEERNGDETQSGDEKDDDGNVDMQDVAYFDSDSDSDDEGPRGPAHRRKAAAAARAIRRAGVSTSTPSITRRVPPVCSPPRPAVPTIVVTTPEGETKYPQECVDWPTQRTKTLGSSDLKVPRRKAPAPE